MPPEKIGLPGKIGPPGKIGLPGKIGPPGKIGRLATVLGLVVLSSFLSVGAPIVSAQDDGTGTAGDGDSGDGGDARALSPVEVLRVEFPERIAGQLGLEGGWLPVYFELKARGDRSETVEIEGKVQPAEKGPPYVTRTTVEVSPGAPRRAWVYLRAQPGGEGQRATVEVSVRGNLIRSGDQWGVDSYSNQDFGTAPAIWVVGGRDAEEKPWIGELPGEISADRTFKSQLGQLPDKAIGYQAFDVVILRNFDESRLDEAQIEALRNYIRLGGFVVFVPDSVVGRVLYNSSLVRELLGEAYSGELSVREGTQPKNLYHRPSLVRDEFQAERPSKPNAERVRQMNKRPHFAYAYALEEDLEQERQQTYTLYDPFSGVKGLVRDIRSFAEAERKDPAALNEDTILYGEVSYGVGRVGVLTMDEQTHRTNGLLRRALWSRIISPATRGGRVSKWRSNIARFVQSSLVNQSLKDKKRDIGTFLIGTIVVGYLILVGPGVYFYLRRKNRLPAIIWVEPLVIVGSLVAVFCIGYLTKGLLTKAHLVTMIHQIEGSDVALRESYFSIFSADDADYRIEASRGDVLNPVFANVKEAQEVKQSRIPSDDGGSRLTIEGFHLNLWQQGHAVNLGMENLGRGVLVELIDEGSAEESDSGSAAAPKYRVTNQLGWTLTDGGVVHRGRTKRLPRAIAAGDSVIVDFSIVDEPVDAEEVDEDEEEQIDPEVVMNNLRGQGLGYERREDLGVSGQIKFWGLVDRTVEDFQLDRPYSIAQRQDFFLVYRS